MEKETAKEGHGAGHKHDTKATMPLMSTPADVVEKIKSINESISREGEDLFFRELPQEVFALTKRIKVGRWTLQLVLGGKVVSYESKRSRKGVVS